VRLFGLNITRDAAPVPQRRQGARVVTVNREYRAAEVSRLYADWSLCHGYSPSVVAREFPTMWGRAREALRNNPYMLQIARMHSTNIVGDTGIRLVPTAKDRQGNLSEQSNSRTFSAWSAWSTVPAFCDYRQRLNFRQMLELIAVGLVVEGEAWLRHVVDADNPYGYSVRLYGAGAVDVALNDVNPRIGRYIYNGIQQDSGGRPVAYWFRVDDPNLSMIPQSLNVVAGSHEVVPASEVEQVFCPLEESQFRGMPAVHTILPTLHMLSQYDEAELVAAREDAAATGVYTVKEGSDYNPVDSYNAVNDGTHDCAPGEREVLPEGVDFKKSQPTRPNAVYGLFKDSVLRTAASGAGVNYEGLANDRTAANYSSMREGKLSERDYWKAMQQILIERGCRPVFRRWVGSAIGQQQLDFRATGPVQLYSHYWRARRWPWVDPASDARYYETCRRFGWKTDAQISDEIGSDWSENVNEIARLANKAAGTYLEANYAESQAQDPEGNGNHANA